MPEQKITIKLVHKLIVPTTIIASLCGLVSCEIDPIKSEGDAHNTDVNRNKLIMCCNICESEGYDCRYLSEDRCACDSNCYTSPYLPFLCGKVSGTSSNSNYHNGPNF